MTEVIGIKFKAMGKTYYFAPGDMEPSVGEGVIVETARGVEYGVVSMPKRQVGEDSIVSPLRPILRIATPADKAKIEMNKKKEAEAFKICEEKIKKHNLEMRLVEVEYAFDTNKILFYFTSDGRVDFRELVKDLASVFRTRIELRQIGVRDEAKMLGGLGICGRPLCCNQYLEEFQPVSIKMAKEQGLSLNPTKISGSCGRLMCCLKYEQEAYEELVKITPRVGAIVSTPKGRGSVIYVSLLKGNVSVRLDNGDETALEVFPASECKVIHDAARTKKPKEEKIDPAELEKIED
ncbi:MAG: stage 0 sporulation family protein [Clostridia bacterium]|nr:stage 0 sporulation family protein [Clostridia bacterium]